TEGQIEPQLLQRCLYTHRSPMPDVLLRTSGEVRFSDFMLWQLGRSHLQFVSTFWPVFNFYDFCKVILCYQTWRKKQQSRQQQQISRTNEIGSVANTYCQTASSKQNTKNSNQVHCCRL